MKKEIKFSGEYKRGRQSFREAGVLMLRVNTEYPIIEGGNNLYEELCGRCEKWAKEKLLPKIKAEYERDEDEQKRFRFSAYEYRFSVQVKGEEAEKYVIDIEAELRRRGKLILQNKREHILYRELRK